MWLYGVISRRKISEQNYRMGMRVVGGNLGWMGVVGGDLGWIRVVGGDLGWMGVVGKHTEHTRTHLPT